MSYQWDFAAIWPYRMLLLEGLWGTIQIGVTSILFGMLAGIALGALLGAMMIGALYLGRTDQAPWALALGAAAFVAALALSRLWMRLYLAEGEARS